MKIAFIVGEFPVLSETFVINQAVGLLKRGHDVHIYADRWGNLDKIHPDVIEHNLLERTFILPQIPKNLFLRLIKGIGLFITNFFKNHLTTLKSVNFFKYGSQAISLWLLYTIIPDFQKEYDIIHCQFGTLAFRGMAFQKINAPEAKLITIFRGRDISYFVREKGEDIYKSLFKTGDYFLVNCDFFRHRLIQLGCPENLMKVHFSGLDCQRFAFKPRSFPENQKIRIVTTGRLVEKKGIEYSIKAVAKQLKITPDLEYLIIGDGELRKSFEQLIQGLEVQKSIKLVGWKNETEIKEILDQSHLFIAPSVTAKDGNQDAPINVLKEAMAMGLPVISTYHGGIPELVQDGVSGFLVPERDVDSLADKLNYLINHPETWGKMGQAGRSYVEKCYDLDILNDKLVEIYQQVIQPKKTNFSLDLQPIRLSS